MKSTHVIIIGAAVAILGGLFVIFNTSDSVSLPFSGTERACTREAKICPDGSTVGREGPNCEFAACPHTSTSTPSDDPIPAGMKVTVQARINQPVEVLGETLIVRKVVEDSRCPARVPCVWAGTVKLDVVIRGGMGDGQVTLELGKEGTSEVNAFELITVTPEKTTAEIADRDYTFTFEVTRRG
jgi:hypothetical protein